MSRIGKNPIKIPLDVNVKLTDDFIINISGKFGTFTHQIPSTLVVKIENQFLYLINESLEKDSKKFHGLHRSLLANKINGVSKPFEKILIAKGVGYRFQISSKKLTINVGYSHPVIFDIPELIEAKIDSNTKLILSCTDKEFLGIFADKVRATRPPEPYKGKGIMYENEKIIRKVGKTGK